MTGSATQTHPRRLGWATLWCALAALAGCADDEISDLQAYVTEVKSRKQGRIEPLPEFHSIEPFTFEGSGRRDPFARAEAKEETSERQHPVAGPRPDLSRTKEELEAYELDSLRMVGTIRLQGALWGLVKAADGTIYRVRPGNHMGRNYGRIQEITSDHIFLVELVSVNNGSWEERQAALDLNDSATPDAERKTR